MNNPGLIPADLEMKDIQAAFWAMLFMCAEMSLGFIIMREKLIEKGIFTLEEQKLMDELGAQEDQLTGAYDHMEKVFGERFQRVKAVVENPEILEQWAQKHPAKFQNTVEVQGED